MTHLVHLPHRSLISIKGRDTFKYLQALTTNNLSTPSSQYTSLLNAQGRVLFDAFIYKVSESECLVEVDASQAENVTSHLVRYKLRSKFEMRRIDPSERGVYSLFPSNTSSNEQHTKLSSLKDSIVFNDVRAPSFGHRIISSTSPSSILGLNHSSVMRYKRHRYSLAVPEGPVELVPEKALPMESNIDYMNGLDFHKGCYLGQELTVRTYHTGVIRKRIVPVRIAEDGDDSSDEKEWSIDADSAQVTIPNESDVKARPAGRVLAGIGSIGIALMRLDKIGQSGLVTINGRQTSLVASRPAHWPEKPESM